MDRPGSPPRSTDSQSAVYPPDSAPPAAPGRAWISAQGQEIALPPGLYRRESRPRGGWEIYIRRRYSRAYAWFGDGHYDGADAALEAALEALGRPAFQPPPPPATAPNRPERRQAANQGLRLGLSLLTIISRARGGALCALVRARWCGLDRTLPLGPLEDLHRAWLARQLRRGAALRLFAETQGCGPAAVPRYSDRQLDTLAARFATDIAARLRIPSLAAVRRHLEDRHR